jgi:hypothetical protein
VIRNGIVGSCEQQSLGAPELERMFEGNDRGGHAAHLFAKPRGEIAHCINNMRSFGSISYLFLALECRSSNTHPTEPFYETLQELFRDGYSQKVSVGSRSSPFYSTARTGD